MKKILFLFVLIFSFEAQAVPFDSKMFSAMNIKIDATAENAAKARDQAILEGHKHALMTVIERITPDYVAEQLPSLIPDDITGMVLDYSLSNEKTSPTRYMADLEVRFYPELVREKLKQLNLPFVKMPGSPVVLLPVYRSSSSANPILWDDGNPWLRAWINRKTESFMVPISVPMGDLSDVQTLNMGQVLAGDVNAGMELAKRYNADGILIAELTRKGSNFSVSVKGMDTDTASEISSFDVKVEAKQNSTKTFEAAVKRVIEKLEKNWKKEKMVQFNETTSLIAMLPVKSLKEWKVIQARLERIPVINKFFLQAGRAGVLQLTIEYGSSEENLIEEMKRRNLDFVKMDSGAFRLQALDAL